MPPTPVVTVHGRVAAARRRLEASGIRPDEAGLDARLLAQEVLGWDAARFHVSAVEAPPPGFDTRYAGLVERRATREPLVYILGRREFWNLTLEVTGAVLVPRPESELIVEAALDLFPDARAALRVADVGTGSGCLAIAIAHDRTEARVVATDISASALTVARRNAARHGVADRIEFLQTDLLAGVNGPFDLIVSNPPYVLEGDRIGLQPEVRDFEPAVALFGGRDGLAIVRRLLHDAVGHLRAGGALVFEFGLGQQDDISRLIEATDGFTVTGFRTDLQGIPRTAIATRT